MSHSNILPNSDGNLTITIDIEDLLEKGHNHPEPDPGVIFIYIYRVDEERYETRHKRMTGKEILEHAGKDAHRVRLFQLRRKEGISHKVEIDPDEVVDFGDVGIERFVTEPIAFHFFIGQKEYSTSEPALTVKQILVDFAKVDPEKNTLAIKTEGGFHEYKNLEELIKLRDCPHFVLFDNCSTPVS